MPGAVISVQTFGDFLNFNPHLHIISTDGCFFNDGSFMKLSRNLGGTMGVSLSGILVTGSLPAEAGLKWIFLCLAIVSISAFAFTFVNGKAEANQKMKEVRP